MIDIKLIRKDRSLIEKKLKRKDKTLSLNMIFRLDEEKLKLIREVEDLKSKKNKASNEISKLKKEKKDIQKIVDEMKELNARIKSLDDSLRQTEERLKRLLLEIPNIPFDDVPGGVSPKDNKVIREVGEKRKFNFSPRPHWEIGEALDILDISKGVQMAETRFVLFKDEGAYLERALINFMLDVQKENGYTEVIPPYLVNAFSIQGTGQLPKFEEELYKTENDNLYLIPTAEVSLVNIHQKELIKEAELPLSYVAYTPCFRREAGSYGKDTKGLIRNHQFDKIELVKFTTPDTSNEELEKIVLDAEKVLKLLKIPYRVTLLCDNDLSFASAKTYDLEVWMPGEGKFREVSSCSNCTDFQARRLSIRFQPESKKGSLYVHTLNGSGVAVGRTFAAILENYQNSDGSVTIPEVLRPYLKKDRIAR